MFPIDLFLFLEYILIETRKVHFEKEPQLVALSRGEELLIKDSPMSLEQLQLQNSSYLNIYVSRVLLPSNNINSNNDTK